MKLDLDRPENFDKEIDAALKLLSETAPPAAMVSRIHQTLEAAAGLQQGRRGSWIRVPAACAAVTAILFVLFSSGHWAQRNRTSAVAPATIAEVTPASHGRAAPPPALVPAGNTRMRERFSQRADVRRSRREYPQYRHVANLLSYPLTRQEKLLVRFVQTAKPADLQMLNPEYQAKVEAQQEAEFAAYLKSSNSSSYDGTTKSTEDSEE